MSTETKPASNSDINKPEMSPAAASATAASARPEPSGKTNPLLVGSYATIAVLWIASQFILIPYVPHLLLLTTAILYAACHASLVLREEPDNSLGDSQHSSTSSSEKETMKAEDAYQFPLVGSVSLFSLYLAFKYLDKDLVNLIIGAYFAVVGCLALAMTIAPAVERVTPKAIQNELKFQYKLKHPFPASWLENPFDIQIEITTVEVLSFIVSAWVCYLYYFQSKPWYLNNVLGICFCLQGIERFSLGTYKIGAILLVGLFFYDIFWVFGTEVMVTVAKSLEGPIKILFPRSLTPDAETGKLDLSLLGLGDIVIPGFFLALLLRFDAHQARQPIAFTDYHADFAKPYFHSALAAYVAGLGITIFVMLTFNAAQPALLYLVPACLGSSLACAYVRGELKELFDYSEEEEEEVQQQANAEADKKEEVAKKED